MSAFNSGGSVKESRAGSVLLDVLDLTKAVTISPAMPSSSYQVVPDPNGLSTTLTVTDKTASGFTLNMTVGVTGTVCWIAVAT